MAKNKPLPTKNTPPVRPTQQGKNISKSSGSSWLNLSNSQNKALLFDRTNYLLLAGGALLIIIGFILMSGGNTDPKVFNEAEIYSFRRITLAPITVILGFIVIVIAILKKPSETIAE